MQFTYQARDTGGRVRGGEICAEDAKQATQQLRQDGLFLLSLDETARGSTGSGSTLFQKRISRSDIIYLTSQLAVMIDAGVSLSNTLEGLARQAENPTMKSMLQQIEQQVQSGDDLSAALARFPKQFDKAYVNLVKASEVSGTLGQMLDRVAIQSQAELETRQKVRGAMMYPGAMLIMCVGVSIFLLTYVFPKLMPMFESRSVEVPLPTKLMISLSYGLTNYWYGFVFGGLAIGGLAYWIRKQPWGRLALDWFWLNVPILGPMLRKVAIGRSLRTLATTVNAGVPMIQAIELSAGVANNVIYEKCWYKVAEQVTTGKQIHEAMEGNRLFPTTLVQMISAGESTGKLGHILNKVGEYYEREIANAIKGATSLIEPIMVVVMGSVIGTIALAMLLPIFTLSSHTG